MSPGDPREVNPKGFEKSFRSGINKFIEGNTCQSQNDHIFFHQTIQDTWKMEGGATSQVLLRLFLAPGVFVRYAVFTQRNR